jgi:hypothetical protein
MAYMADRLGRLLDSPDGARVDRFDWMKYVRQARRGDARQGARDLGGSRTSMTGIALGVA